MPYGSWINDLPTSFFLVVHIAAFTIGAAFAWLAFKREQGLLGTAFSLFAAAEGRGDSFSSGFPNRGTFDYECTLHSHDMRGTVIVS